MKKIINVRFPLFIVLSLVCGILLGYLFVRINISLFYLVAVIPPIAVILILCCCCSKYKLPVYCLFGIFSIIIGISGSYLQLKSFTNKELINGDTYSINATVCEKGETDFGEYIIIEKIEANGRKASGKIKVYLSSSYGDFCDVGYKVNFTAQLNTNDTFPYGKLNYNAEKNIKYNCFVRGGLTAKYKFSLFGSANNALRNTLYSNLDKDTASVAYAMLTGNTDGIDDETLTAFRYGGIAHIFAVSGLHIGIIYGLLRLLCKKLHLNKYLTFALCITPIFFYAGICGFTISSVRALIMCAVALTARTFFTKYDALNSLSVAAVIILFINPLTLFNIGFQLSVSAVGAIILLSKNIVRPFKKVPRKLTETISVSLSSQAGTLPVMLARFGYLSGAGILLNIILVPILSLFFGIIFTATVISLILPFSAQYILHYAALPLDATLSFLINAGFEKTLISGFGAGAFIPVYFFGLFMLSDKFNLSLLKRIISVGCSVVFLCIYVPLKNYTPLNGRKIIISAYYNGGAVLLKSDEGNILIITEDSSSSYTQSFLNEYYSHNLKATIILGGEDCISVLDKFKPNGEIYVYGKYLNIQPYDNFTINYEKDFSLGDVNFEYADGYSLTVKCDGVNIAICAGKYNPIDNYDLLICDCASEITNDKAISFNERSFKNCVYADGNFEFLLKDGKIK